MAARSAPDTPTYLLFGSLHGLQSKIVVCFGCPCQQNVHANSLLAW